jgi:hypothetical protein
MIEFELTMGERELRRCKRERADDILPPNFGMAGAILPSGFAMPFPNGPYNPTILQTITALVRIRHVQIEKKVGDKSHGY